MRFYKILFSLLLMFLIACRHDGAPENLIDTNKFIPLMVDIHLADAYLTSGPQFPDSVSQRGNGLYQAIFNKYQVDSVQFKKSFRYYSQHVDEMNKIYTSVVAKLNSKNDSITKYNAVQEAKVAKRSKDSLARVSKKDSVKIKTQQDSIKKAKDKKLKSAAKPIAKHK